MPGLISEAFRMTVLPQARGAAIARTARMTGAFHGAMPNTTPTGCRTEIERQPLSSVVCTWPLIWVTNDATSRSMLAARSTLKLTHGRDAPVSPIMKSANSSDLEARISAAASSKRRRSVGFTAAHAGNAAAAVSAALWASCNVAAAARVTKAPVRGSCRSNVRPFEAGIPTLLIRRRASILILQLRA